MGRRGPPPTPTSILAARGSRRASARPDSHAVSESLARIGDLDPPASLLSDRAIEIWSDTVEVLRSLDVLADSDREQLAIYCEAMATAEEAAQLLEKEGLTYETPSGQLKPHPAITIRLQHRALANRIAQQFGLTPSARASIRPRNAGELPKDPDLD